MDAMGAKRCRKSAVFDAITFALFGAHRAGSGARNARELINHHADKFIIEFDFMVDGVAYRIRRTCAQNGRSTRLAFILQRNGPDDFVILGRYRIAETDGEDGLKEWVTLYSWFRLPGLYIFCPAAPGKERAIIEC